MIDYFKNLDLHDTPIKSMEFDFYNGVFKLDVLHHDGDKNDYFEIKMTFFEVSNFQLGKLDRITESEITNFDMREVNNRYSIEFDLLCDKPFYPVELHFQFSTVIIDYPVGSSPHMKL